jgi:hypothetical protein
MFDLVVRSDGAVDEDAEGVTLLVEHERTGLLVPIDDVEASRKR